MRKENMSAIQAQAHLHHAYLLGLQLMVSTNQSQEDVADWMFRLFRRQHLDKFLASFEKLGLSGLPDAVACAKYHVLSNNVGGVGVEYMYESDQRLGYAFATHAGCTTADYLWGSYWRQSWFLKWLVCA